MKHVVGNGVSVLDGFEKRLYVEFPSHPPPLGARMDSATGQPDDYQELYECYFPMICKTVSTAGIIPDEVEDVAMDILTKFLSKDGLNFYDPSLLHDTGRVPTHPGPRFRPARFASMLRGFVKIYVLDYRDKQVRRATYEVISLDSSVSDDGVSLGEVLDAGVESTVEKDVCIRQVVGRGSEQVRSLKSGSRDYTALMEVALEQGLLDGVLHRGRIAAELGVSVSTVGVMLREMREILHPLFVEAGLRSDAAS